MNRTIYAVCRSYPTDSMSGSSFYYSHCQCWDEQMSRDPKYSDSAHLTITPTQITDGTLRLVAIDDLANEAMCSICGQLFRKAETSNMATFNRLDDGSHVTYQIVDDTNTIANLSPDEAFALLTWLSHQQKQLEQDMNARHPQPQEPSAGPPFMQSGDEYEVGDGPVQHIE